MPRFDQSQYRFDDNFSVFDREFMSSGATLEFDVVSDLVALRLLRAKTSLGFTTSAIVTHTVPINLDVGAVFSSSFSGVDAAFIVSTIKNEFNTLAQPRYVGTLISTPKLETSVSSLLDGTTSPLADLSLLFSNIQTINGTTAPKASTDFTFETEGSIWGPLSAKAKTDFNFKLDPFPTGLAEFHSDIYTNSKVKATVNGRFEPWSFIGFGFDTFLDLRRSPWQGLSEVGNAIFQEKGLSSNYGRLPYGEEIGL